MSDNFKIISPNNTFIDETCIIEDNVTILPNCFITNHCILKKNSIVGPNCELNNTIIGENSIIKHAVILDSEVGNNCKAGPYVHIRNHSVIKDFARIGNFVEIKNSVILENAKVAHLAYIGDANIGKNVNYGCGCITVNYNGKIKSRCTIGDNVFIGCNSNLIAPINIGNNAYIAAGSTVTDDVPNEAFCIARERQIIKENYAIKYGYGRDEKDG